MLNFTRQERLVIYFLVITLGIGTILRLVRNQRLEIELTPERFYEEEQAFKQIAAQINLDSVVSTGKVEMMNDKSDDNIIIEDADTAKGLINLNTADVETLSELPGIGPAIANRIKAYTDQHGPFKNKKDIILVKGIGKKIYTRIQGLVTTE